MPCAAAASSGLVRVRTPSVEPFQEAVARLGGKATREPDGAFEVSGVTAEALGEAAAERGIVLHELTPHLASLEEAFMELTRGELEYGHDEAAA